MGNSRAGDKVDEVNGGDGVDTCQADRQRRQGQRLSVEPAPKRSCLASTKGRSYSSPDPSRANSPLSGPPLPRSSAPKAGTPGIIVIAEITPRLAWKGFVGHSLWHHRNSGWIL